MMRATMLLAGLLGLAGCGFAVTQFGGHDYTEHHGVLVVDGTQLPHKRWVAVNVPVGTGSLELGSATADIVLTGKATSIQRITRLLRQRDIGADRRQSKAYWAPGKTGLD